MSDEVEVRLSEDTALVLLALIARINETRTLALEDQAEQRVLWDLEADLEASITAVVSDDYVARLEQARDRLRDSE